MEQLSGVLSYVDKFSESQTNVIAAQSVYIDSQISKLQASLQTVMSRENDSSECVEIIHGALQDIQKRLSGDYVDWASSLTKAMDALCSEVEGTNSTQLDAVSVPSSLIQQVPKIAIKYVLD